MHIVCKVRIGGKWWINLGHLEKRETTFININKTVEVKIDNKDVQV